VVYFFYLRIRDMSGTFITVRGLNGLFQKRDFLVRQEIEVARPFPC